MYRDVVEVGARALFWEDNWLVGCSVKYLAPNLWAAISPRIRRSLTVHEGLSVGASTHARTAHVVIQYLLSGTLCGL
jgi:hypothetical protein